MANAIDALKARFSKLKDDIGNSIYQNARVTAEVGRGVGRDIARPIQESYKSGILKPSVVPAYAKQDAQKLNKQYANMSPLNAIKKATLMSYRLPFISPTSPEYQNLTTEQQVGSQAPKFLSSMAGVNPLTNALTSARGLMGIGATLGVGGGINKAMGGSFTQGVRGTAETLPSIYGIGRVSNPLIANTASRLSGKLANPIAQSIANRTATGLANIPEGVVMSGGINQPYSMANAGLDFGSGFLFGSGVDARSTVAKKNLSAERIKYVESKIPKFREAIQNADEEDRRLMEGFIDLIRIKKVEGKPVTPELKKYIMERAQIIGEGLGVEATASNRRFAEAFELFLDSHKKLVPTDVLGANKMNIAGKAQPKGILKSSKIDRTRLTGLQLETPNAKLKAYQEPSEIKTPDSQLQKAEPILSKQEKVVAQQGLGDPISSNKNLAQVTGVEGSQSQLKQMGQEQGIQATDTPITWRQLGSESKPDIENRKITPKTVSSKGIISPNTEREIRAVQNAVKTKVNLLDYVRTPDRVLEKMGLKKEANLLKNQYNSYLDQLPKEIDKITQWYNRVKSNKGADQRIFKYLDGQDVKLDGEELKVAGEMQQYLKEWANKLDLPEDKRVTHYITHIFEKDFIQKEFDPDLAKILSGEVPGSVYDPFLQQRLGKMGYVEDVFRALDAYVKRATRKYNMDPALKQLDDASSGLDLASWNYVKSYADGINMRPTQLDELIDNLVKSSPVGYKLGQRPLANVSRGIRQMVYRGTLGLNVGSAIRNLTQGVNTYAQLGEKYTGIGYVKALRSIMARDDELSRAGVLRDQFIQERSLSATKKFWERLDKRLFTFFELAEKINRGSAYFGAKTKALSQGMSEEEAVKKGVEMARKTQFTFGSVDTPVALQSDMAKMLTQFQSFNIKQTEFLTEMAKNKEYAGMVRWLGANTVILYTVGQAMGWDWKDFVPFGGVLEGRTPIGGTPAFQLAGDVMKASTGAPDQYGQPTQWDAVGKDAVPFFPAGVQLKKTFEGLGAYNQGYSASKSGLVRYPIEQNTSNAIRTGLFGQYNAPEARQYFDKERTPLSKKQSETFKSKGKEYYDKVMNDRDVKREKKKQSEPKQDSWLDILNIFKPKEAQASPEQKGVFTITNPETGNETVIDLSQPINRPTPTGLKELDTKARSAYYSKVGTRITQVYKLYEDGQLSAEVANKLITILKTQQARVKTTKAKKSSGKSKKKMPQLKISKISAPSFAQLKPLKVSDLAPKKQVNIPRINLDSLRVQAKPTALRLDPRIQAGL